MSLIKHHHRGKMLNGLGVVVFLGLPWLLAGRTPSWTDFGRVALLLVLGGFAFGQIFQLANLTIDTERKRYVCWWGPFVPLWRVEGHLGDIIGLEVAGSWAGHVVRLHRRTGSPIRLDAHKSEDEAQQAAAWLATDLETQVLNRTDRSTPLNIATTG
jgi:hypothetical protein